MTDKKFSLKKVQAAREEIFNHLETMKKEPKILKGQPMHPDQMKVSEELAFKEGIFDGYDKRDEDRYLSEEEKQAQEHKEFVTYIIAIVISGGFIIAQVVSGILNGGAQ